MAGAGTSPSQYSLESLWPRAMLFAVLCVRMNAWGDLLSGCKLRGFGVEEQSAILGPYFAYCMREVPWRGEVVGIECKLAQGSFGRACRN